MGENINKRDITFDMIERDRDITNANRSYLVCIYTMYSQDHLFFSHAFVFNCCRLFF